MATNKFTMAVEDNDEDEFQAFQEILEFLDNAKAEEEKEYGVQDKEGNLRDQRVAKIYNKVFGIARQYLDEDSPVLFVLRDRWAIRLRKAGWVDQAVTQNTASVYAHERVHGEYHVATLNARRRLGECYAARKEYRKAVQVYDAIITAHLADPQKSNCRDLLGLNVDLPTRGTVGNTSGASNYEGGAQRVTMEGLRSDNANATRAHCNFIEEILKDHSYKEAFHELEAMVSILQQSGQEPTLEFLDNEIQTRRDKLAMMLDVCHPETSEHKMQITSIKGKLYTNRTADEIDGQRHDQEEDFSVKPLHTGAVVKVQEENNSRNPPSNEQRSKEPVRHPLSSDMKHRESREEISKHQCLPTENSERVPRVNWSHAQAGTEALTRQELVSNTTEHTSTAHELPNAFPSLQLAPKPKEMHESNDTTAQATLDHETRNMEDLPSLQYNGATCEDSYRPMPGAWPTDCRTPPETPKLSRSCSTRSLRCDSLLSPLKPDARRHSISTEPRKVVDFAPSVPISQSWTSEE
jgi:tetratricopeptide (TPR) repeat protein